MSKLSTENISFIARILRKYIPNSESVLVQRNSDNVFFSALVITSVAKKCDVLYEDGFSIQIDYISRNMLYTRLLKQDTALIKIIINSIPIYDRDNIFLIIQKYIKSLFYNSSYISIQEQANKKTFDDCFISSLTSISSDNERFFKSLLFYLSLRLKAIDNISDLAQKEHLYKEEVDVINKMTANHSVLFKKIDNLLKKGLNLNADRRFSVFFRDAFLYPDFIENVFLKISEQMKSHLNNSHFLIQKVDPFNNIGQDIEGVLLTYTFETNEAAYCAESAIKEFLFQHVGELKLKRLDFRGEKELNISNKMELCIVEKLNALFQQISSELVFQNSANALTIDRALALVLFFYIKSGISYYGNVKDFLEINNKIYDLLIFEGLSDVSLLATNSVISFAKKEKIEKEYSVIYEKNKDFLMQNYQDIMSEKVTDSHGLLYISQQLSYLYQVVSGEEIKIESLLSNFFLGNMCQESNIDKFFVFYTRKILNLFFIDNYYLTFIPYLVKKMKHENF